MIINIDKYNENIQRIHLQISTKFFDINSDPLSHLIILGLHNSRNFLNASITFNVLLFFIGIVYPFLLYTSTQTNIYL